MCIFRCINNVRPGDSFHVVKLENKLQLNTTWNVYRMEIIIAWLSRKKGIVSGLVNVKRLWLGVVSLGDLGKLD